MAATIQIDRPSLGNNIETIFALLESSDIHVVEDIRRLILDNLSSGRESWLIHTLVDYYYVTHSTRIEDILAETREPQDKPLLDKLQDGLKSKEHQLPALQLLLHIVYKQPHWTHKIVGSSVFTTLLKCLKNAIDIPVLMTALMIITMLLPVVPVTIERHLQDIFDIFMRLSAFSIKKPANTPDIFLLHLQVALYSMLHRLYGMYPSSFLTYLRQQYKKKDNTTVFEEVILPMLERVRLHPFLIVGSRDQETSTSRWKSMETQDIVVECAKMSLDLLEGTWEQLKCPIFAHASQVARDLIPHLDDHHQDFTQDVSTGHVSSCDSLMEYHSIGNPDMYLKYSPSVLIGLSTPPLSQRNTPATSFMDISTSSMPQSQLGTYTNTPHLTPIDTTPRETPTIGEESERTFSRNSSRSLLHKSDPKRQSSTSSKGPPNLPDLKVTPGSQPSSVPPSPLKAEFTAEPPKGALKTQPVRRAIRELRFDRIPEVRSDQLLSDVAPDISVTEADDSGNVIDGKCRCDSAAEAVTMESLDHVMQAFGDNNADGELDDPEVSEINRESDNAKSESEESYEGCLASGQFLTAESVKQFMTKVNRIRFNSLTSNEQHKISISEKRSLISRSSSCPLFKQENEVIEESEMSSRCASTSFHSQSEGTIDTLSPDEKTKAPHEPVSEIQSKIQPQSVVPNKESVSAASKETSVISPELPAPSGNTFNIMNVFQNLVMPASIAMCQHCRNQLLVQNRAEAKPSRKGSEIQMFSSLSPVELLDRHLKMGSDLHAKELTKIPLTSKETVHWTHFGGAPPVDEVNILRGQVLLLHNQLQYERHKRDLHAKRNRRLLRKIANATALEEQNKAMTEQIRLLEGKIHNMQVSLRLLQDQNQELRQAKDSNEYEKLVQFRLTMQANRDLEMSNTELKSLLITQREDHDKLKKMVQETEHRLFNKEKQLEMMKEAVSKTNKLKEHIFQQQKEMLLLGELQQKYQEKIDVLRQQQHAGPERDHVITALKAENKSLKSQLDRKTILLESSQRKLAECEDILQDKEVALNEVKTKLETVKRTHDDELKATEAKYTMTVRVNQEYEGRVLELFTQIDQLQQQLDIHRQQEKSQAAWKGRKPAFSALRAQSVPPDEDKSVSVSDKTPKQFESPYSQNSSLPSSGSAGQSAKAESSKQTDSSAFVKRGKRLSEGYDSMSVTSQEASSVFEGKGKFSTSMESEDGQSVSSRSTRTTDSGFGGKPTK